jgi:molecular chaperone HscB
MAGCWSCGTEAGGGPLCAACGQIQPGRPTDWFEVFGLPDRFHLDVAALEKRYRELSKKVHPDRFAKAGARERRFALEQSTMLNQAFKGLKDATSRAAFLLKKQGFSTPADDAGKPGAGQKLPLEFYEEVIEDREALLEAKDVGPEAVQTLAARILARQQATVDAVDRAFSAWEASHSRDDLAPAETELAKLRYYARFLDEVEGRPHE